MVGVDQKVSDIYPWASPNLSFLEGFYGKRPGLHRWPKPLLAGGNSNIFNVHPLFEEDEPILTSIFQLGWFNHQPVYFSRDLGDLSGGPNLVVPPSAADSWIRRWLVDPRCTRATKRQKRGFAAWHGAAPWGTAVGVSRSGLSNGRCWYIYILLE